MHRFFSRANEYIDSHGGYPSALKGLKGDQGRRAGVRVLNNLDWFRNITFLDFLRDVGKLARVNVMLSRDSYVHLSRDELMGGCVG